MSDLEFVKVFLVNILGLWAWRKSAAEIKCASLYEIPRVYMTNMTFINFFLGHPVAMKFMGNYSPECLFSSLSMPESLQRGL